VTDLNRVIELSSQLKTVREIQDDQLLSKEDYKDLKEKEIALMKELNSIVDKYKST